LGIEADLSLPTERVIRFLDQIIEWRGKPAAIRSYNEPEDISHKLKKWAHERGISLLYIQPEIPGRMLMSNDLIGQRAMNG